MAKSDKLPILKDGDTFDGQPCIQPAGLRWCDLCECLRRDSDGWIVRVVDGGIAVHICPKHEE